VKNNKKNAKILEKRHGKYWQQVFQMSVDEEIVNRYSVIDLVLKSKEVLDIQKKFNVSKENSSTRVIYIDRYRYAVLVTWFDPSEENKQIPGQQLMINLAIKTVTKSNKKFDWKRVY
jgi:UTP-glucose-1-phosphate uridylyltransferase